MSAKLAEISTTLLHISARMDEMAEQTREFRREAREDAQQTRQELRTEIKDVRSEVSAVGEKLTDPETGLAVLKTKLDQKPGFVATVTFALAIVVGLSAIVVYAEQIRALFGVAMVGG